jgi:hypothetical protein
VHQLGRDQPNSTKELHDIATRHTSGEDVVRAVFVLGEEKMVLNGSRVAPSKATSKVAKKSDKGGKKGQKRHPRRVTFMTSGNNYNKDADGSNEEYVTATEHDFKHQAQQLNDHFEKLL